MEDRTPKTAGIPPAQAGALSVLQFATNEGTPFAAVGAAAQEIAYYHAPDADQASRHVNLSEGLAHFLAIVVRNTRPGPERSTAISRAREAKMWASAAVALEDK